ncbi:MAG: hypothetical protein ACO1N5_00280 [Noviherbaspirillum sp.]
MATITIKDLPANRALDRKAMSAIRGCGAPWVFGWIRPHIAGNSGGAAPVFNFIEINNTFNADQMINQFQSIDIRNAAPNATIDVAVDGNASNAQGRQA